MKEFHHVSVLLWECIEGLNIKPDGIYVDGTLGRAGHSREIAKRLTSGRLICIDRDAAAIEAAEAKGWTLTVQWNGTPTSQASATYGLRTPSIYARVTEDEYGRHLEWGHYVSDPTGYEEFYNLEAAHEYFGIEE